MDPRRQTLSRHATKHLQFKPGSDVAMLNAMINTIITEGLTDEQYIAGYTEGYADLKAKITEFTPERMAPICGIPAETLREVARMYARAKSSIIFWGMGISQHVHGTAGLSACRARRHAGCLRKALGAGARSCARAYSR
jgi:formate dehydrogenase major subunit